MLIVRGHRVVVSKKPRLTSQRMVERELTLSLPTCSLLSFSAHLERCNRWRTSPLGLHLAARNQFNPITALCAALKGASPSLPSLITTTMRCE